MLSELVYVAGAFLILKLILYYLLPLAYTSYVFFLSKTIDFKKYGKWAVVTGATDGIGKAYSEQLAEKGMNVVLVSRTLSKLEEVASDLREKYRIETKVIAVDFSNVDIYDVLRRDLCELQIGILVNNVGMTYGYPQNFHEVPKETVGALINVNMFSVAEMTHIVLPRMLDRNKGIIVNVGSLSGVFSQPLLSEYSGAKAFSHFLTKGIQYETRQASSIIIQYVAPGAVSTKMIAMSSNFSTPSPSYFVSSALRSVGKLSFTAGCFIHDFNLMMYGLIPEFILMPIVRKILLEIQKGILVGARLILKLILYYLLPLVYSFYVFFLSKTIDFKKYGEWAVVTGATDGIGKGYSEQLAERGMNVVLVSRTLSKLEEVASDLREKYRIETKVIAVDFSNADIYDVLRRDLCELQIGILVNNVGMTYGYPQYFHEISKETVGALINVNMLSMAVMTHIVLPRMLERNKGIIVNMGSMGGFFSLPLLSGYSGTKAFDHFFTRGIQYENTKTSSIIIQYVAPGAVATKMIGMSPSLFAPTPSYFVSSALRSVGKLSVTTGCFKFFSTCGWKL